MNVECEMADLIAQDTRRTFENSNRAFATEIHAGENVSS